MSEVEITSVSHWNTTLREANAKGQTVFADFYATWCGPCKTIAPVFEQQAKSYPQGVFVRVDVDKLQPIAQKYKVSAMPTFHTLKNGTILETLKGADPNGLKRMVAKHVGPNPPVAPLPPAAEEAKASGNTLFKEGDFAGAAAKYAAALEHAPGNAVLLSNKAFAHLKQTPPNAELALANAQAAVEADPKWAKGYVRLGDAYDILGQPAKAKGAYEKAVALSTGLVKEESTKKLSAVSAKLS